ncbi:MAG: anti-sigma factor [Anaerolineales bacterium]
MSEHPIDETLQVYLDGELTQQEVRALEAHLQICPECAAELTRLRSLFLSIESLPSEPLATDLAPGVMAAVRPRIPSLAFGELLAAAALTAGLVLWLGGAELQDRLAGAAERLIGQLEVAAAAISTNLNDLLNQAPDPPQLDVAGFGDLIGTVLVSPSILWAVAAAALALWLLGNGLVLRRVRREG